MNKGQRKLTKMMSLDDNSMFSGGQQNNMIFDKSVKEEEGLKNNPQSKYSNSVFKS